MLSEGVDCVVRMGELEDSSLIARSIGYLPMVTCAAPSYLESFGTPHTLADLETHRAVNYFFRQQPTPYRVGVHGEWTSERNAVGVRDQSQ